MSENEKLPDENINPSQAGQDMCPARCCCTLSYQIRIFILRDLIKLAFTRQNMCAAQTLKSRTHNSHFGLGSKSCIGRLLFRHRENFASRDSSFFQFGTSGSASFHSLISAKLGIISHSQIKTNGENRHWFVDFTNPRIKALIWRGRGCHMWGRKSATNKHVSPKSRAECCACWSTCDIQM